MESDRILNIVGPRIRAIRVENGVTQDQLSARCQVLGFDVTRGTLAKIESQVRAVSDHEIPFLAAALEVPVGELFPKRLTGIARKPRNSSGRSK